MLPFTADENVDAVENLVVWPRERERCYVIIKRGRAPPIVVCLGQKNIFSYLWTMGRVQQPLLYSKLISADNEPFFVSSYFPRAAAHVLSLNLCVLADPTPHRKKRSTRRTPAKLCAEVFAPA